MAKLIIKFKGEIRHEYPINNKTILIGRSVTCEVFIDNLAVSRVHAEITHDGDKFIISDLNSGNGTYVNGICIATKDLKNGDLIRVGKHVLEFISKGDAVVRDSISAGDPNIDDYSSEVEGTIKISPLNRR